MLVPGGFLILTVPYANESYDTFVPANVYEPKRNEQESAFFQRHYDASTLQARLIDPATACQVEILEVWRERWPVERWLHGRKALRAVLSPLEPFLAMANLCRSPTAEIPRKRAATAFLVLKKTA